MDYIVFVKEHCINTLVVLYPWMVLLILSDLLLLLLLLLCVSILGAFMFYFSSEENPWVCDSSPCAMVWGGPCNQRTRAN